MKLHTLLALICISMLTPSLFGQTNAPAESTNAVPAITNTVSPFQQAVTDYQASSSWAAAQNVAKLSATVDTLPPTPAEARRHLVMGQTIFKAATSTNDFQQAYAEFYQASTNAPWVANIWNNMAVAAEAEARYDVATNCFQIYQNFKLSDSDAQEAQDKVYEIQAKQKMQADKQAQEQKAAADAAAADAQKKQEFQDKIGWLAGTWNESKTIVCNCPINGRIIQDQVTITITGKNVLIASKNPKDDGSASLKDLNLKGTMEGDDYTSIKWVVTGANSAYSEFTRLPDFPVNVTVDKSAHQISWTQPSPSDGVWSWEEKFNFQLTQ